MKYRSAKQAALYVHRRALVHRLLAERPMCQIRWDEGCTGVSTDVDEILGLGVGGSILDESNMQTCCRWCHHQKTVNPAEAVARGFTRQRSAKVPTQT